MLTSLGYKKWKVVTAVLLSFSLLLVLGLYLSISLNGFYMATREVQLFIFTQSLYSLSVLLLFLLIVPSFIGRRAKILKGKSYHVFTFIFLNFGAVCIHTMLFGAQDLTTNILLYLLIYGICHISLLLLLKRRRVDIVEKKKENDQVVSEEPKEEPLLLEEGAQLCYVQGKQNYCELLYIREGMELKKMLRTSMKQVESQLTGNFMRVHKSYILNLSQVRSISGNANNTYGLLKGLQLKVPISRSRRDEVLDKYNSQILQH